MGLEDSSPSIQGATDDTYIGNIGDQLKGITADTGGTGSLTALNTTVEATTQGYSTVGFIVTGTWVGTISVQASLDGTNFVSAVANGTGQSVFAATSSNDSFRVSCGSFMKVRLIMSAYTSGTANVVWNSGTGTAIAQVWNTNAPSLKTAPRSDVLSITSGTAGSLNADLVAAIDVGGYQSASVQVLGTWAGTLTFQGSDNNSDFVSVSGQDISSLYSLPSFTTTTNGIFLVPLTFRYFRVRMTSYTSGTATSAVVYDTLVPNDLEAKLAALTDGTDIAGITTNNDLKIVDGLRNGGVYGALSIPTANTPVEAKVGGARLANRKFLQIYSNNNGVFWGLDNSVTTTSGIPLVNQQVITFEIDPDSTFQIWLVGNTNGKSAQIVEAP